MKKLLLFILVLAPFYTSQAASNKDKMTPAKFFKEVDTEYADKKLNSWGAQMAPALYEEAQKGKPTAMLKLAEYLKDRCQTEGQSLAPMLLYAKLATMDYQCDALPEQARKLVEEVKVSAAKFLNDFYEDFQTKQQLRKTQQKLDRLLFLESLKD